MHNLTGKVAVITGGSQGIGLGIALAFATAGAKITISGRDEAKLAEAARQIEARGAETLVIVGDVRQRQDARRTIDATVERFDRIDVLVNNAQSSIPATPLEDIDDEAIALTLDSGLLGTLHHMQAAFPHMKGGFGSIINFGSREGIFGGLGFGIYAATKEGIRGLSRVAAREWGKHGIRVNVICPAALSPAAADYLAAHPSKAAMYLTNISLGYFGDPEADIGPVALFLASDASKYVTGQTLSADGGQIML